MLAVNLRLQTRLENTATRTFRRMLNRQTRLVLEGFALSGEVGALEAIETLGEDQWLPPLQTTHRRSLEASALLTADLLPVPPKGGLRGDLQGKGVLEDYAARIVDWVRAEGLVEAKLLHRESRTVLRDIVRRAVAEGLGPDATARRLRSKLSDRSRSRSRAIARTETHNAAAFGSRVAADASPIPLIKEWLTLIDDRERQSHHDIDGTKRPKDLAFAVGRPDGRIDLMQGPGDSANGSAANLVNCRCGLLWLPA